ncbi:MAG: DUF2934 domain-containing protein [Acidobacteriota bacterium]|nr:DUF2934 domain-containing protein [Acidobacteriota bacterium]
MPSKREEADGPVKATRRRTSTITLSSSTPASDASPNVTEAKPPTSVSATVPAPTLPVTETPYGAEEEIRRRAYELYEQDGRQHGRDHDHWLRAEAEVLSRANDARSNQRAPRRGQKSA